MLLPQTHSSSIISRPQYRRRRRRRRKTTLTISIDIDNLLWINDNIDNPSQLINGWLTRSREASALNTPEARAEKKAELKKELKKITLLEVKDLG